MKGGTRPCPYLCKVRVGIFCGGASREREISYAGGRTVYDLLDRRLFEPVPLFLDVFHRFVRLAPRNLYYGKITDFFPPPDLLPGEVRFPVYAEQLWYPESSAYLSALTKVGPILPLEALAREIDLAFLVLHGLGGEDGTIQGLLSQAGIPYTGTGLYGSSWGLDKARQRAWLEAYGFPVPKYLVLPRSLLWENPADLVQRIVEEVGLPCVIKHPLQGSTLGVAICRHPEEVLKNSYRCAFTWPVSWLPESPTPALLDLTQGIGLPALYRDEEGRPRQLLTDWRELSYFLAHRPRRGYLEAWDAPSTLLVERFIQGEEFSVIVIEAPDGTPVALPPTHIRKAQPLYDYRAKYLSGISHKKTPSAALPNDRIRAEAEKLAQAAGLQVYARLDGIVSSEGEVFFNDPNTTSGMLPASLLFHQAAEAGFTPTAFLSHLIERSLQKHEWSTPRGFVRERRLSLRSRPAPEARQRIAVVFGGSSTERHISLESGRNIVQKLSSKYEVIPLFLRVEGERLTLWEVPPRLLFKDNADDVAVALEETEPPAVTVAVRKRLEAYGSSLQLVERYAARQVPWEELPVRADFVFLALHGRPGEDGTVQARLENLGLPYNGSPPPVCALLMDKEATHRFVAERGFRVPPHQRVSRTAWQSHPQQVLDLLEERLGPYPFIGKPVDEGCSSAVRVLVDRPAVEAYLQALLRESEEIPPALRERLSILPSEPFPPKNEALIEKYLYGSEWIEVTVGVITHTEGTRLKYQAFLPSETLKTEGILSLEEKFLAGVGQNSTPARLYPENPEWNSRARQTLQQEVARLAETVGLHGYARVDGFARLLGQGQVEFWLLEVNTLPGLTPATVFFHQAAAAGYTPLAILEHLIAEGCRRQAVG